MEYTTRKLFVLISIIFALIFAFSLIGLYGTNNIVYADAEVSYLEYNTTTKVFDSQTLTPYTAIETTTDFSSGGTFVLDNDVTLGTIDCGGSTNNLTLILCDGKTLTLTGGISNVGNITIYAQENGTGKIVAGTDLTTGTLITAGRELTIHGGEISTGIYSVNRLISASNGITIYGGSFNGTVGVGIYSTRKVTIENANVNFVLNAGTSSYGIESNQPLTINNGTYSISGAGKAIYARSGSDSVTAMNINGGIYNFTNVTAGFWTNYDLIIDHGKINITASTYAFRSENHDISIRGTVFAQSEDTEVAYANRQIRLYRANVEFVTHSSTSGVYKSTHVNTAWDNVDAYYKDSEDGAWSSSGSAYTSKYLKTIAGYYDITVWVDDIKVDKGTDISSIVIPYVLGMDDWKDQEAQETYADLFAYARTLFTVETNCDPTIPGEYNYYLDFVSEYEGNINDEYHVVLGDNIGHFIVKPPISYLEYNTSTKEFDTQTLETYNSIETATDFSSGGTFVLDEDVTVDTIDCGSSNDLTLILCDGKTLTLNSITNCNHLTIYAQEQGTGKILAASDMTSGIFIHSYEDLVIHGGEISTGTYSIQSFIYSERNLVIYNASINGTVNKGIDCDCDCTIVNATLSFTVASNGYGFYIFNNLIINNGTYTITGLGTAIYCNEELTINNGIYSFENVKYGFYARKDLTINHGKVNITAARASFKSEEEGVFVQGTLYAQSENSAVIEADKTITFSYCNFEGITHSSTIGVLASNHDSTAVYNADFLYKDTEDDEWYSSNTKNPSYSGVKFLKAVPSYNHITVWVEDITVEEGTDISSMIIPYGFGMGNNRTERVLNNNAKLLATAATLFSVTVNCDGTTPGTYDYVLSFGPEYEGCIDDHYDIVFGNEIGHFIVTAAPPTSTPEPEPEPEATPSPEQASGDPTPTENPPQTNVEEGDVVITEGEIDEDLVRFWEEYGCIGLVVVFIDAFMLFDWLFVIMYLIQNKRHPNKKSILASKIARLCGLIISIGALIFAIVAISIHTCTFSIIGVVGAAIVVALFGVSYVITFDKDRMY